MHFECFIKPGCQGRVMDKKTTVAVCLPGLKANCLQRLLLLRVNIRLHPLLSAEIVLKFLYNTIGQGICDVICLLLNLVKQCYICRIILAHPIDCFLFRHI